MTSRTQRVNSRGDTQAHFALMPRLAFGNQPRQPLRQSRGHGAPGIGFIKPEMVQQSRGMEHECHRFASAWLMIGAGQPPKARSQARF